MLFKKKMCNKGLFYLLYAHAWYLWLCSKEILLKKIKRKRKNKKNQNAFTWLQAYFLKDVRVIWSNFLGDSHFQTNVIDDIENLFDYYLYITLFVLCTLISCTHYKKSLLNSIRMIMCWLIWPSLIAYEPMCKCKFLFWLGIWRKMCLEV